MGNTYRTQKTRQIFVGDFETTVYDGQERTDVWASALVPLNTENVMIWSSLDETVQWLIDNDESCIIYYHNLKFDGSFWLSWCLTHGYTNAVTHEGKPIEKEMPRKSIKYDVSDMGLWYGVTIKLPGGKVVELRDSLKLIPLSVREIGNSFGTKHKKLDMEYEGERHPGGVITLEERRYIANDVLVVKEALELMFQEGHNRLTIGSCCMSEFSAIKGKEWVKHNMPDLYELECPVDGFQSAGAYIVKAYRGGWVYVAPGKQGRVLSGGVTADVNSLYPYVMSGDSGNQYPIGEPEWHNGSEMADIMSWWREGMWTYPYVRFRCRFHLKSGMLPFVQIKGTFVYRGNECLTTSDFAGKFRYYTGPDGERHDTIVTLTMTGPDYILFREHYDVEDFEIMDGCMFRAVSGIFDEYIDKYRTLKQTSKGGKRQIAKLYLNNLYGKLATSPNSSYKIAVLGDDGVIRWEVHEEYDKRPGYIAMGAAVTSYARCYTIRAAQANYYGPDKAGFCYADTDSIHVNLPADALRGIKVHSNIFGCWKLESYWDRAIFTRQKTYIEHVTHEDGEPCEPHYDIKCAGMGPKCKLLMSWSLENEDIPPEEWELVQQFTTPEEYEFMRQARALDSFVPGLVIPGKLMAKTIPGGTLLCRVPFEMR